MLTLHHRGDLMEIMSEEAYNNPVTQSRSLFADFLIELT